MAAASPIRCRRISRLVASLHDEQGRIAVAGFYDSVRPPSNAARAAIAELPFSEERYFAAIGAPAGAGEAGYTLLERQWLRPTLELNGLWGGYEGPGTKTVIPTVAQAKITCRLVPDQEPKAVTAAIARASARSLPAGRDAGDQSRRWPRLQGLCHPGRSSGPRSSPSGC